MKVKVFALQSAHSVVSFNFAKVIEEKVNSNSKATFDGESYDLVDYDIKEIENKSYLILRYKKV